MVYTCEEAWEQRNPGKGSVHLQQFPEDGRMAGWMQRMVVAAKWDGDLQACGRRVTEALEVERREKRIGSSLEAAVAVTVVRCLRC